MTVRAAIILAGGRASRLGGADKASVEVDGRRLVDHVYAAVTDCEPVIAVGPDSLARPGVTVVREQPAFGGPVAALAAALRALVDPPAGSPPLAPDSEAWVLACDLPRAGRIVAALDGVPIPEGADAVVLADADGRAQWLAGRYRIAALVQAVESLGHVEHAALRQLLAPFTLRTVPDTADASLDLDTWAAVEQYREQHASTGTVKAGAVEISTAETTERTPDMSSTPADLDAWVTDLSAALDLGDLQVPTGLLLDLTRDAAHGVTRPAGPLTTYLVGIAVARGASPEQAAETVRELISKHQG